MIRIPPLLRNLTFIHQLYITMAVAILSLAFISSLALSWQSNRQTSANLIDQGLQVAENLARQSQLALVYDAPENATDAVSTTLAFPDVTSLEIRHSDGRLMLYKSHESKITSERPKVEASPVSLQGKIPYLESESEEAWQFVAPVLAGNTNDSQSNMDQPSRELLGYVRVVKSKATLSRMRNDVFTVNFTVSSIVAIVLLIIVRLLTKQLTRPLTRLFTVMTKAEAGASGVRADPAGPKDIKEMALMFNKMMNVLEARENELRAASDNALKSAKERIAFAQQEQERLETTVAERTKSLNELLETRAMIVNNASHELRTPVNALRLLLDAATLRKHERRGIMTKMDVIVSHMSKLVENLLLLNPNQMQSSRSGVVQDFDLGKEIRATVCLLDSVRQKTSTEFTLNIEPCDGIRVRGDLTSLRRILINLGSNAFQFTNTGSVIVGAEVSLDPSSKKTICTMRFRDTGCGIASDMQNRIFEPFVTTGSLSGHTGTGLGLPICRQLAQNLNGYLRLIRSVEGEGSEFECQMCFDSLADNDSLETNLDINLVPSKGKRLRILVAEDDPITADALCIIVRHLQHDVDHVSTYMELQNQLLQTKQVYDFAFIDNRLPGGRGLDLIRLARQEILLPDTCLVLLSADTGPLLMEEAVVLCDHVLTKPTSAYAIQQLLGKGIPASIPASVAVYNEMILDPAPLNMLINSGATKAQIREMCDLFLVTVSKELIGIKGFPPFVEEGNSTEILSEVVHRIRSSCSTIGAISLGSAFKDIAACSSRETAQVQLDRIESILELTSASINQLLE